MSSKVFKESKKARRDRKKALIIKVTGDKHLASTLRDASDKKIAEAIKGLELDKSKRGNKRLVLIEQKFVTTNDVFIPIHKKETKSDKDKRRYKEATTAGYTPKEASDMRGLSQKKFDHMLQFNKVKSIKNRVHRWASMARREDYDSWIHEEVERINRENGLDDNASFGWNAVYMYYTEGGTLEFWESYFVADPLNQNIYKARTKTVWNTQTRARRLKF